MSATRNIGRSADFRYFRFFRELHEIFHFGKFSLAPNIDPRSLRERGSYSDRSEYHAYRTEEIEIPPAREHATTLTEKNWTRAYLRMY